MEHSALNRGPSSFWFMHRLLTRSTTTVYHFTATFDEYYFLGLPLFARTGHRRGFQKKTDPDTGPLEKADPKYGANKQTTKVNKNQA